MAGDKKLAKSPLYNSIPFNSAIKFNFSQKLLLSLIIVVEAVYLKPIVLLLNMSIVVTAASPALKSVSKIPLPSNEKSKMPAP